MKISNETKVGVLVTTAIVILVVGYNFMKGESLLSSNNTYYAVYTEIDNLLRSNPVVVHGHKVGYVNSVDMDHETLQLIVSVKIPSSIKVPKNSILKITNNDLLGSKVIELILGQDSAIAIDGDTLIAQKDAGMAQALTAVLTPLTEKVNSVLGELDTAMTDVDFKETIAELNLAIVSFKNTTNSLDKVLAGKSEQITSILSNIDAITRDIKSGTPKLASIIESLETTSEDLAQLDLGTISKNLNATILDIKKTLKGIQDGQGSLGKLANDDELWNNLNRSTVSLDSLLKDIQRYPRRYFGITDKQKRKGDKQKELNEDVDLPTDTKK
ncbi:MAG: phospholipid/cholesterol/gamma-HCH transport system substrate-binding protein [Bacteroidia bacterium]|jgi:phospholipid/cholesterol/gamma-HCH transport system substrate-binding protein